MKEDRFIEQSNSSKNLAEETQEGIPWSPPLQGRHWNDYRSVGRDDPGDLSLLDSPPLPEQQRQDSACPLSPGQVKVRRALQSQLPHDRAVSMYSSPSKVESALRATQTRQGRPKSICVVAGGRTVAGFNSEPTSPLPQPHSTVSSLIELLRQQKVKEVDLHAGTTGNANKNPEEATKVLVIPQEVSLRQRPKEKHRTVSMTFLEINKLDPRVEQLGSEDDLESESSSGFSRTSSSSSFLRSGFRWKMFGKSAGEDGKSPQQGTKEESPKMTLASFRRSLSFRIRRGLNKGGSKETDGRIRAKSDGDANLYPQRPFSYLNGGLLPPLPGKTGSPTEDSVFHYMRYQSKGKLKVLEIPVNPKLSKPSTSEPSVWKLLTERFRKKEQSPPDKSEINFHNTEPVKIPLDRKKRPELVAVETVTGTQRSETQDSFVNSQEWTLSQSVPELKVNFKLQSTGGRFKKEIIVDGQSYLLLIRDEGGPPELQFAAWVDAVVFVFSLEDEISFQTVYNYFLRLSSYRNTAEVPMVLVGTQDAISAANPRVIDDSRARKLSNDLKRCTYYETCATYGLNVERVFQDVAQKVVALRKKQQLSIGPCKSLPNSPSHSSVTSSSIPSVHINQLKPKTSSPMYIKPKEKLRILKAYGGAPVNLNIKTAGRPYGAVGKSKGIDLEAPGSINGVPLLEVDLDSFEDKPWRKPGADLSDYFNYGFNEDTWKAYCEKQKRLRMGLEVTTATSTSSKITVQQGRTGNAEKEVGLPTTKVDFTSPTNVFKPGIPPSRKVPGTINVIGGQTATISRVEGRRRHNNESNNIQVISEHSTSDADPAPEPAPAPAPAKLPPFFPPGALPPNIPPPPFLPPPPNVGSAPPLIPPPSYPHLAGAVASWSNIIDNSKQWEYYSRREKERDREKERERERPRERGHERERERERDHSPASMAYNSDEERFRYREYAERGYERHRERSSREKEDRHRERRHRDKEESRHKSSRSSTECSAPPTPAQRSFTSSNVREVAASSHHGSVPRESGWSNEKVAHAGSRLHGLPHPPLAELLPLIKRAKAVLQGPWPTESDTGKYVFDDEITISTMFSPVHPVYGQTIYGARCGEAGPGLISASGGFNCHVGMPNLAFLSKDAIWPNKPCRVSEVILKHAYSATAFAAWLGKFNSILVAYRYRPSPQQLDELCLVNKNLPHLPKLNGQAAGRNLAALVATHRQLWLS
ncbi:UNVERIFIED_CONTAM: hypothetical protein FKN15_030482 [Acipenser sinensis]